MGRDKRILVTDDDDAIRTLLFTVLRRRGFKVDTARNGKEALERLERCAYSIILLDLMMPIMSGYDVLERLVAQFEGQEEHPLVIVLTAGIEPRDLDPAIVAGTIRKPFDVELLCDTIAACMATVADRSQSGECPQAESDGAPERDGSRKGTN